MERKVNRIEWRKKEFVDKFRAAALELGGNYKDVQSIKFKDSSGSKDYRDLINQLVVFKPIQVDGNYQGRAWKLTDSHDNSIVIVEHETGLEILYILGAYASFVSVVPVVVSIWERMRDEWPPRRGRFNPNQIDRRYFNGKGSLIEEPAPPVDTILMQYLLNKNDDLNKRILHLETEVTNLKKQISKPDQSGIKKPSTRKTKTAT